MHIWSPSVLPSRVLFWVSGSRRSSPATASVAATNYYDSITRRHCNSSVDGSFRVRVLDRITVVAVASIVSTVRSARKVERKWMLCDC